MLRSLKEVKGYGILAKDGPIGSVHDFFFDDRIWAVRYIVADTGSWLPGKKVLLVPSAVGRPSRETRALPVALMKEQVKNSPDIDAEKTVSRQREIEFHKSYLWAAPSPLPHYGIPPGVPPIAPAFPVESRGAPGGEDQRASRAIDEGDPHLRSVREVTGYHIQASDGEIGHAEEFIAEDETWVIRYMVVDTKDWLPGRKVLVSPGWIERVSWPDSKIFVDLPRETVKNSPAFDPGDPVNRQYEERLYDYYGRPKYW